MNSLKNENINAEFTLQSCGDIKEICAPLFQSFPINYFSYVKHFLDGGKAVLSANREVLLNELAHDNFTDTRSGNYINLKEGYRFILEESYVLPKKFREKYEKMLLIERLKYNITTPFAITKNDSKSFDCFAFMIPESHPEGYGFYLNNLEYLERFILYFKDKAHDLIEKAEKNKLVLPNKELIIPKAQKIKMFTVPNSDKTSFMKATERSKYTLQISGEEIEITKREKDCADLLLQGFRSKEIAKKLYLSPRTIESYLETLKEKTDSNNQSALIQLLYANRGGRGVRF